MATKHRDYCATILGYHDNRRILGFITDHRGQEAHKRAQGADEDDWRAFDEKLTEMVTKVFDWHVSPVRAAMQRRFEANRDPTCCPNAGGRNNDYRGHIQARPRRCTKIIEKYGTAFSSTAESANTR
jgi:hypothetical protein